MADNSSRVMPVKKKNKNEVPKEIIDSITPDVDKCLTMYEQILTIFYRDPKTKMIEIEYTMNLIGARITSDKANLAFHRVMSEAMANFPQEPPREGTVPPPVNPKQSHYQ